MKKCPYCNKNIQNIAIKCRFCGERDLRITIEEFRKVKDITQRCMSCGERFEQIHKPKDEFHFRHIFGVFKPSRKCNFCEEITEQRD